MKMEARTRMNDHFLGYTIHYNMLEHSISNFRNPIHPFLLSGTPKRVPEGTTDPLQLLFLVLVLVFCVSRSILPNNPQPTELY